MTIEKTDLSGVTILLIDDNTFVRRLVSEILTILGVGKVLQADSADAGFARMNETKPDVILCDWLMEGQDGLDVLRAVREGRTPIDPRARFIMLTGKHRPYHVVAARALGADSYIAKPVSAENLMRHLVEVIGGNGAGVPT